VHVEPGPPFGEAVLRERPIGRIGGIVGIPHRREAEAGLLATLGPGGQLLNGAEPRIVADWDSCWLDDAPVMGIDQWRAIVDGDRMADVEGAFAVAWLTPSGALRLARDGIGERSLYYALLSGGLVFASSVRAILASGLAPRTVHRRAVATYLTYAYLPGRETLVEGVFELLPGEVVEWTAGQLRRWHFWSLPSEPVQPCVGGEEDLRDELRARLELAVRRRLATGEPVGATLSGGIDSSLVVALARRLHDAEVHTYSVSFGKEYPNELPFSSLVANHCRTRHRIVELAPAAVLHHLDESIGLLSDPIGDPLTVPNALLFREASASVGVMLNGEGGDPCFGGPKNQPMLLAELLGDGSNDSGDTGFARERSYLRSYLKCYDDLPALLAPDIVETLREEPLERDVHPRFADARWPSFVGKLMAVNIALKGGHHILPKVEAESAPFGLLPRSPLFDRRIVEMAFMIPPQLKLHGSIEKYLLKQAVRDLLPQVILDRPKSGMLVPVEGWFRGPLAHHARERLLDGLAQTGLVRRDYLERLLAGRLGGLRPRHGAKIWLLLTLESWLRTSLLSPPTIPTREVRSG
jgi:asparagine synthase (glutamine-hydrolysing)